MGSERMSWSCLSRAMGVSAAGRELDGREVVARWAGAWKSPLEALQFLQSLSGPWE